MSSRDDVVERLAALRACPVKHLLDPRTREVMQRATASLMSLPDDERFLAGLLEQEYDTLGGAGDLLVCETLQGAIAERKVREALPTLHRMLVDPRVEAMHEDLAETLGQMGDASSVPWLIKALSSKEVGVRAKAARSLGSLGDSRAVLPLILLLKDDSDTVRENAIKALADAKAAEAASALQELAASSEEGEDLRATAIGALGRLRIREALPLLRKLSEQEEDEDVKEAADEALAAMDEPT